MTNRNDEDDTPKNPRVKAGPAPGLGALHLSADDMLSTAAACFSCARVGHDSIKAGHTDITPTQVAQLYQLAATWLRVLATPSMEQDIANMEQLAADVIREAAAGDLDRIRRTATAH